MKTHSSPPGVGTHKRVVSNFDKVSMIFVKGDDESSQNLKPSNTNIETPYMVNEYFNDLNGLSFYLQLRRDQNQPRDRKEKSSKSSD